MSVTQESLAELKEKTNGIALAISLAINNAKKLCHAVDLTVTTDDKDALMEIDGHAQQAYHDLVENSITISEAVSDCYQGYREAENLLLEAIAKLELDSPPLTPAGQKVSTHHHAVLIAAQELSDVFESMNNAKADEDDLRLHECVAVISSMEFKLDQVVSGINDEFAGGIKSASNAMLEGPVGNRFFWDGAGYAMPEGIPGRLIALLWDSLPDPVEFDGLAESVWGDIDYCIGDNAFKEAQRKANKFFDEHEIPFGVSKLTKLSAARLVKKTG